MTTTILDVIPCQASSDAVHYIITDYTAHVVEVFVMESDEFAQPFEDTNLTMCKSADDALDYRLRLILEYAVKGEVLAQTYICKAPE